MVCLDLEQYDYNKGAQTLIRATEGTILDRLPPASASERRLPWNFLIFSSSLMTQMTLCSAPSTSSRWV